MTRACNTSPPPQQRVDTSGWDSVNPTILRVVLFSDRGEHTSLGWEQKCDRHQNIPAVEDGIRRPHHPTATLQAMGFEGMALGDLVENFDMQSLWAAASPNITYIDVGRMNLYFDSLDPHSYAQAVYFALRDMVTSTRALISNRHEERRWRFHMYNRHR